MQTRTAKPSSPGRRRWLLCPIAAACATVALAGAAPATAPAPSPAPTYRVIPLAPSAFAAGINARGQVAFTEFVGGVPRARLYDGTAVRDLGTFGGPDAVANALNDLGQVVGTASTAAGVYHAFRWSRQTGLLDLNGPGVTNSNASDINNKGQVAGTARFPDSIPPGRAFRWSPQAGMVNLGSLGPTSTSIGTAINEPGTVVGSSEEPQGPRLTLVTKWPASGGGPIPLNAFPSIASVANDINNAGQIVGSAAFDARLSDQAFIWTPQYGLRGLGTEPSYLSFADRINQKGLVIGELYTTPGDRNGFIWSRDNGLLVVGTPLVDSSDASDLNNRGQVVGTLNGRGYVWTRAGGFVDLTSRVVGAPPGLTLFEGQAINDGGTIAAVTNTGSLVLLVPQAAYHQPPVAGPVTVTGSTRVNVLLSFTAGFTDVDVRDTHKAVWAWGDGSTTAGTVSERNGTGSVSAQHAYRKSGIYPVRLTITDSSGKSSTVERTVTVCGCSGGGAIAGAGMFVAATGKQGQQRQPSIGSFAFLSERAGKAEVRVTVGGMALRSSQVDAVTVDGARVQYSGRGTVNGAGNYRFTLTATSGAKSGGKDRIHVRIAHNEPGVKAEVVDYDNGVVSGKGAARQADGAGGAAGGLVLEGRIAIGAD